MGSGRPSPDLRRSPASLPRALLRGLRRPLMLPGPWIRRKTVQGRTTDARPAPPSRWWAAPWWHRGLPPGSAPDSSRSGPTGVATPVAPSRPGEPAPSHREATDGLTARRSSSAVPSGVVGRWPFSSEQRSWSPAVPSGGLGRRPSASLPVDGLLTRCSPPPGPSGGAAVRRPGPPRAVAGSPVRRSSVPPRALPAGLLRVAPALDRPLGVVRAALESAPLRRWAATGDRPRPEIPARTWAAPRLQRRSVGPPPGPSAPGVEAAPAIGTSRATAFSAPSGGRHHRPAPGSSVSSARPGVARVDTPPPAGGGVVKVPPPPLAGRPDGVVRRMQGRWPARTDPPGTTSRRLTVPVAPAWMQEAIASGALEVHEGPTKGFPTVERRTSARTGVPAPEDPGGGTPLSGKGATASGVSRLQGVEPGHVGSAGATRLARVPRVGSMRPSVIRRSLAPGSSAADGQAVRGPAGRPVTPTSPGPPPGASSPGRGPITPSGTAGVSSAGSSLPGLPGSVRSSAGAAVWQPVRRRATGRTESTVASESTVARRRSSSPTVVGAEPSLSTPPMTRFRVLPGPGGAFIAGPPSVSASPFPGSTLPGSASVPGSLAFPVPGPSSALQRSVVRRAGLKASTAAEAARPAARTGGTGLRATPSTRVRRAAGGLGPERVALRRMSSTGAGGDGRRSRPRAPFQSPVTGEGRSHHSRVAPAGGGAHQPARVCPDDVAGRTVAVGASGLPAMAPRIVLRRVDAGSSDRSAGSVAVSVPAGSQPASLAVRRALAADSGLADAAAGRSTGPGGGSEGAAGIRVRGEPEASFSVARAAASAGGIEGSGAGPDWNGEGVSSGLRSGVNVDRLIEVIEERVLAEVERRGGRYTGLF